MLYPTELPGRDEEKAGFYCYPTGVILALIGLAFPQASGKHSRQSINTI